MISCILGPINFKETLCATSDTTCSICKTYKRQHISRSGCAVKVIHIKQL